MREFDFSGLVFNGIYFEKVVVYKYIIYFLCCSDYGIMVLNL